MAVYIAAVRDYNLDELREAVEDGMDEAGIDVEGAQTAVIKTNIVQARTPDTGVVVHPMVVEAIADVLVDRGVRHITIAEASAIGVDVNYAFSISNYTEMAKRKNIRLMNLFESPRTQVHIGYGYKDLPNVYNEDDLPKYHCGYMSIPNVVLESDVYINVAKLKTHNRTTVSLTMKNQWGLLSFKDRQMYHRIGLHEPIAQLARAVQPAMTVIDGILGMEGNGPILGTPRSFGAFLVGRNMTETDIIGSSLMQQNPQKIIHLQRAVELGMGAWDVQVKGVSVEQLAQQFEPAPQDVKKNHNFYVWRNHRACHLDDDAFINALKLAKKKPKYWPFIFKLAYYMLFKRIDVVRGRGNHMPEIKKGQRILISGDCALDLLQNYEEVPKNVIHIPGCPPDPEDIIKAVLKM
jgi:uncharacterized protein (DUF362 family)